MDGRSRYPQVRTKMKRRYAEIRCWLSIGRKQALLKYHARICRHMQVPCMVMSNANAPARLM